MCGKSLALNLELSWNLDQRSDTSKSGTTVVYDCILIVCLTNEYFDVEILLWTIEHANTVLYA